MGKYINILTLHFDTDISNHEIVLFRGAVLRMIGEGGDVLFHNHNEDNTYRYSYPMIQYKRLGKKASIVCVGDGTDKIGRMFTEDSPILKLGEREVTLKIEKVVPARMLVQIWNEMFEYKLVRWLPLNPKNYMQYREAEGIVEKTTILERILKGNMLSMLKGLGIFIDKTIDLSITKLSEPYIQYNKGIALMAFDVDFKCNLSIPNNIGIGKNASIGFGVIREKRIRKNTLVDNNEN